MRSDHILCGGLHRLEIGDMMQLQSVPAGKDVGMRRDMQPIAVLLLFRAEARVKLRIAFLGVQYADIGWKMHIERDCKLIGCHAYIRVEMRHLRFCVYAAVRATRSVQRNLLLGDFQERMFDGFLHGNTVRLRLPADVIRSVVCKDHADSSHITK